MGLLCISVDLDEVDCYHAIHGLDAPRARSAHVIYNRAIERIAGFLAEIGTGACTFFIVGKDVAPSARSGELLRELAARGAEMANHTMHHRYDLTRLGAAEQRAEVLRAADAIAQATGQRPVGFRAPGYNFTSELAALLSANGYYYDSSLFPCPVYYLAKVAAIGLKAIQGRRSQSLIGDPRQLGASPHPYRMAPDDISRAGSGLRELPITVLSRANLPFIGTSIALAGKAGATLLARLAAKQPFVNLEFHGIDFVDADGDGLGHIKPYQPELRIPLVKRRATFERVIHTLTDAGMEPVTLAHAASRLLI